MISTDPAATLADTMADYAAAVMQTALTSDATQARLAQAEQRNAALMAEVSRPTIWERIVGLLKR